MCRRFWSLPEGFHRRVLVNLSEGSSGDSVALPGKRILTIALGKYFFIFVFTYSCVCFNVLPPKTHKNHNLPRGTADRFSWSGRHLFGPTPRETENGGGILDLKLVYKHWGKTRSSFMGFSLLEEKEPHRGDSRRGGASAGGDGGMEFSLPGRGGRVVPRQSGTKKRKSSFGGKARQQKRFFIRGNRRQAAGRQNLSTVVQRFAGSGTKRGQFRRCGKLLFSGRRPDNPR